MLCRHLKAGAKRRYANEKQAVALKPMYRDNALKHFEWDGIR